MIKSILFDAGGVLHVSNTALEGELKAEFNLTDDQVKELFSHYIPLMGTSKISEAELWELLHEKWGIRNVSVDEKLFTRSFGSSLKKMPGVYELVEELKEQGLQVMLLTNVSPQYAEVLESRGHYDPFELRVLSYEVGYWKPEPEIYHHALNKINLAPEETIFVDDAKDNITAAESLGIHGIVFQNAEQLKRDINRIIKENEEV